LSNAEKFKYTQTNLGALKMLWKLIAVATQTLNKHLSPKSFLELIY